MVWRMFVFFVLVVVVLVGMILFEKVGVVESLFVVVFD